MSLNGILAIVILIADIFAILKITQSSVSTGKQILWIVLVLILPVIGLIAWFFAGPGNKDFKL